MMKRCSILLLEFLFVWLLFLAVQTPCCSGMDSDYDGVCNPADNCPMTPNADQQDWDGDGQFGRQPGEFDDWGGDACDLCTDTDHDGFGDPNFPMNSCQTDNCPYVANFGQEDLDQDGIGNACDRCIFDSANDQDGDLWCGNEDNCPESANPDQNDQDGDKIGDRCDPCPHDFNNDQDHDGACGDVDNCPSSANPDQNNRDRDAWGDGCDSCPDDPFNDRDHDSICGDVDNCPLHPNSDQVDSDHDGRGDACPWQREKLQPAELVRHSSMRIDSMQKIHIVSGISGIDYLTNQENYIYSGVIDQNGEIPSQQTLALDSQDHPHIAYRDRLTQALKYTVFNGVAWNSATIDSESEVTEVALTLDRNEHAHIIYHDRRSHTLRYAFQSGDTWLFDSVPSGDIVQAQFAMILDAANRLHLVFYDAATQGPLRYALRQNGVWQSETLQDQPGVGGSPSLAVDSANQVHLTFDDASQCALVMMSQSVEGWQSQVVDQVTTTQCQFQSSLQLDSAGRMHIAYRTGSNTGLKYALVQDGSIQTNVVDASGNVGDWPSIALVSATNTPYILYLNEGHTSLMLATPSTPNWDITSLFWLYDLDQSSGFALDHNDRPYLAYSLHEYGDLWLTKSSGDSWQSELVDFFGLIGYMPRLKLDSSGQPHLCYLDLNSKNLKYAFYDGLAWHVTTVDQIGPVSLDYDQPNDLALDSLDQVHLAYYDTTKQTMKYAKQAGDGWAIETISAAGPNSRDASIAIDSQDRPHLAFIAADRYIRYAHFDGQNWQIEALTTTAQEYAHDHVSLFIDSQNQPHLAYYSQFSETSGFVWYLRYAEYDGLTWHYTAVDKLVSLDRGLRPQTSLFLDQGDLPHIAYQTYDSGKGTRVKYAFFNGKTWMMEYFPNLTSTPTIWLDSADLPHIAYAQSGSNSEHSIMRAWVPK